MASNIKEPIIARNGINTQVSSRNDIFEEDMIDEEETKEETARMDALMRKLLGDDDDDNKDDMDINTTQESEERQKTDDQEEAFSFKLFSSAPLAEVNIKNTTDDTANDLSKAVADQQIIEFDDADPEFLSRVSQAAVEFDTIIQQSQLSYPAMKFSRRVTHILENGEVIKAKNVPSEKPTKKKSRKSKKYRDFQKAVKDGKIVLKPNMRNPQTPEGWPGWPGHRTNVAIINNGIVQTARKKANYSSGNGRGGGQNRRGFSRGQSRGGGFRGRGRGRGF